MTKWLAVVLKALVIVVAAAALGVIFNLFSPAGIPLLYAPPKEVVYSGVKIRVIDEKEARQSLDDGATIFLDARDEEDFQDSHIKGALSMPSARKEERFPRLEPMLPKEGGIIVYCTNPECHMAEQVAAFLAQLGYENLRIMTSGLEGWTKAGYPVQSGSERKR
ncbi:MAG: rhodanese-like domain-containing protein [Deltaproteobacteria bacterium]|nr:rhodanese-like domain-containing protein [Deltaproteobacteria bacterium]